MYTVFQNNNPIDFWLQLLQMSKDFEKNFHQQIPKETLYITVTETSMSA